MRTADFKDRVEPISNLETIVRSITRRPDVDFVSVEHRVRIINEDAENVERYILVKLDLKNKRTSLRVARYSTGLVILAAAFTVITIIFTLLLFLTSLFTLPIAQFQNHQFIRHARYCRVVEGTLLDFNEAASSRIHGAETFR